MSGRQSDPHTVVVVLGGDRPHPDLRLPPADQVVAADSGARWAAALGLPIDLIVGDMDSLAPAELQALRGPATQIERHHPDKDATDGALAVAAALRAAPARVVVVGGHGGRLDHHLATVGLLAAVAGAERRVEAWMGAAHIVVVATGASAGASEVVPTRPGELVSLLPVGGEVTGVCTVGLRWALDGARLEAGTTWAISNEALGEEISVTVGSGAVAVVRPHALEPASDAAQPVATRPAGGPQSADGSPPGTRASTLRGSDPTTGESG